MKTDPGCVFCKIIKGEIPCHKVYEDEYFLAFLDIHPSAKGHTLLVFKDHTHWWTDLSDSEINISFNAAKKLSKKLKEKLNMDFVRLNITGRDVPHFHIHLIPLKLDQENSLSKTFLYQEGEAEEIAQKIRGDL